MEADLERLSIAADEDEELTLAGGEGGWKYDLCLVGRFLTDRSVNPNVMKHRLADLWKPRKGVSIQSITQDCLLIRFFHQVDLERVLEGAPWTFNNHLLLLHHLLRDNLRKRYVSITHVFRYRYTGSQHASCQRAWKKQLGNFLGEYVGYDAGNNSVAWRSYIRIGVKIDVRNPLKRWKKIQKTQGECSVLQFKYERVSTFSIFVACWGIEIS